jgi:gliding motility-associated-like protein
MKKLLLVFLAGAAYTASYAQTFVNRGAPVAVTQGGLMIVKTDGITLGSGSLENDAQASGSFKNKGLVVVEGSFVNTSGVADGYASNTGEYRVQKDWTNNGTFTADQSLVTLYGTNQNIGGRSTNTFYNLTDSTPIGLGTKIQTDGDVTVTNTLWLSGSEHATAGYQLYVTNANPTAIVQNGVNDDAVRNGFVSSTGYGRLVRATNQKAEYIFPTGVNAGGVAKIREASIVPANTQARTYKVRLADDYPSTTTTSTDGYDTLKKSGGISEVNDVFYHIVVASDNASPADLSIFSDQVADGGNPTWTSIGNWRTAVPQWENMQDVATLQGQPNTGRVKFTKGAWTPTTDTIFALIDTIPIKKDFNFPTAFIPDANGVDPNNTVFQIINVGDIVSLDELSVFNRWGEMVFNSKRDGVDKWNGHYQGKLQQQGNYVYLAKVRNKQTQKLYPTVTGNVALIW